MKAEVHVNGLHIIGEFNDISKLLEGANVSEQKVLNSFKHFVTIEHKSKYFNKILMIKLARQLFGLRLADAKELVEFSIGI